MTRTRPKSDVHICSICRKKVPGGAKGMLQHKWKEHKEEMARMRQRAIDMKGESVLKESSRRETAAIEGEPPPDGGYDPGEADEGGQAEGEDGDGEGSGEQVTVNLKQPGQSKSVVPHRVKTDNLLEANAVAIVPKVMQISSSLLPVAMAVTRSEWNWPEMSVDDWLDTYLYYTLRANGIVIGAWHKISDDGSVEVRTGGNGHGNGQGYPGNGRKSAVRTG